MPDGSDTSASDAAPPDESATETDRLVGDGGEHVEDGEAARQDDQPLFDESIREFPWLGAAGTGVATFLVEYVAVALLFVVGPSSVQGSLSLKQQLVQYGYILYNAHHVPVEISTTGTVQLTGSQYQNVLYGSSNTAMAFVYFLIPVAGLFAAGWLFARYRGDAREDGILAESALVSGGVAAGYVTIAIVGTFLLVRSTTTAAGTITVKPMLLATVAAMVAFALLLSALGAGAYGVARERL